MPQAGAMAGCVQSVARRTPASGVEPGDELLEEEV